MRTTSSRGLAGLAALLLVTAAACGDDDDDDTTADTTAAGAEAPATTAGGTEAPAATEAPAGTEAPGTTAGGEAEEAGGEQVMAGESELGTILVDEEGMTLYLFVPDEQGPSTCTGDCIAAWPAVAGPATAGEGADESMLATATRPDDGSEQATYNGWPLYYFAQDAAAGDTSGQGLGDNWWVIDPATGEAVQS